MEGEKVSLALGCVVGEEGGEEGGGALAMEMRFQASTTGKRCAVEWEVVDGMASWQ